MNVPYIIGGIALILFGMWLAIIMIKTYAAGVKDKFGLNMRLLTFGVIAVVVGVIIVVKHV